MGVLSRDKAVSQDGDAQRLRDELRVQLGLGGEKRHTGGDAQSQNGKRQKERQGGWPGCVSGRVSENSSLY